MTDFNSLDPETRCLALVGKFLQKWAAMEAAICAAIQTALSLDPYQTAIVTSNTGLRDKIHILRTLVSLLPFQKEKIDQFDKNLEAISKASGNRNMMAHDAFAPSSDGKGVAFSVTKAKGKLTFPDTIWYISHFETKYAEIDRFTTAVAQITEAFNQKQVIDRMRETARANPAALYYYGFVQGTPRVMLDSLSSDTGTAAPKTDD